MKHMMNGNCVFLFTFYLAFLLYNGDGCENFEVLQPFYPYYVKEGSNLTLQCQCSEGNYELEWLRQTAANGWVDTVIVPTEMNNFRIRTLTEDPSGFVESTLVKLEVSVEDKGTYVCRDIGKENNFAVWVTILKVMSEDVYPVGTEETLELRCQVTGFATNPSDMMYRWERNGKVYEMTHLDKEMVFEDKYIGRVTFSTSASFIITKPDKNDAGKYTCSFIIQSDIGPQIFSETVHVYGTNLQAGAGSTHLSSLAVFLVILGNVFTFMHAVPFCYL